ncbi:MAG: PadR family transcriptional regulator [archaeon]|nr:MAG: PadR family transcriptional regulator [archaeon]
MTGPFSKKWLHPQTVPRGFLRLYILTLLSKGPETGYSIMQKIDERTDGAWRPGAGTMYPLMKNLVRSGLVKAAAPSGRLRTKVYSLTPKGQGELEEIRRSIATVGRKDRVMMRLFSELLPGTAFVPMMLRRFREGNEVFREKFAEIPQPQRAELLKEMRLNLELQLDWVDAQMGAALPSLRERTARKRKP